MRPGQPKSARCRLALALTWGWRAPSFLSRQGEHGGPLTRPTLWLSVSLGFNGWMVTIFSKLGISWVLILGGAERLFLRCEDWTRERTSSSSIKILPLLLQREIWLEGGAGGRGQQDFTGRPAGAVPAGQGGGAVRELLAIL